MEYYYFWGTTSCVCFRQSCLYHLRVGIRIMWHTAEAECLASGDNCRRFEFLNEWKTCPSRSPDNGGDSIGRACVPFQRTQLVNLANRRLCGL